MTSNEIRKKYLEFFEKRGHTILPSAPLVPENDQTTLFNTAGMQPLVPYLLGKPHPGGKRLANIQKCVRTGDIDEVGDNTHLTFFEMMGNWSLGDYFKEDAIKWSYELLTSKTEGFGLNPQRLYVTCFEGNENAPKDEKSANIWQEIFKKNNVTGKRIYFLPAKNNWWQPGPNGPCGPDTEMFYDLTGELDQGMTKEEYLAADDAQKVVEIWNDVFMEYIKKDDKVVNKLENKNVDTGSGFERVCTVLQGKTNVFDTDLFKDTCDFIDSERRKRFSPALYEIIDQPQNKPNWIKRNRIIADHLRTALFLASDGVTPSNKDRGYVLRKLLRRIMGESGIEEFVGEILEQFEKKYKPYYRNINSQALKQIFQKEFNSFKESSKEGLKEIFKMYINSGAGSIPKGVITGKDAFYYFSTFGIPKEMFVDRLNTVLGIVWNLSEDFNAEYDNEFTVHQELSRTGAEQKFKGGLGGHSEMEVKYHTATHLLHQALREVLGNHVEQKGSNITPERLRFDFAHTQKMTDEEKRKVEEIVNQKIKEDLPVQNVVLPKVEAEASGALHFFGDKYGEQVSVYFIGPSLKEAYSKEFCGGPHVERTGDLAGSRDPELAKDKVFKISKEEAVSAGVRRIKAVLTPS